MAELAIRWFAAMIKPAAEAIAAANLTRQGFESYAPKLTVERVRDKRIVIERESLFGNYLLIRFSLSINGWKAINSTLGIIRLLGSGVDNTPTPLPQGEIERLQEREKQGKLFVSTVRRLRRNDEVKFKCGWAVDQIGVVAFTRGERVAVLLNLLNQEVRVIAPSHVLEFVRHRPTEASAAAVAVHRLPAFITNAPVRRVASVRT